MSLRDFSEHAPRTPFAAPAEPSADTRDGIEALPEIDDMELCVSRYNVDQAVVRHVPDWPLD